MMSSKPSATDTKLTNVRPLSGNLIKLYMFLPQVMPILVLANFLFSIKTDTALGVDFVLLSKLKHSALLAKQSPKETPKSQ